MLLVPDRLHLKQQTMEIYKTKAKLPGQLCVKQAKGKTIIPRLKPHKA